MSKKIIYICAVLQLQGIRKQPFEAGEKVTPDNFPVGNFDELLKKGYIKESEQTDEDAKAEAEALAAAEAEAKAKEKAEAAAEAEAKAEADKAKKK